MDFIRLSNVYLFLSGILIVASVISIVTFGLQLGIDFTGGSILEAEYLGTRPSNKEIQDNLSGLELGSIHVQPTGERGVIIRMRDISEDMHQQVLSRLTKDTEGLQERRFESIGPVIGKELQGKTFTIVIFSFLAIVLYVTFAFRRVVKPIRSWNWSVAALVALIHDVLITLGILSVFGKLQGLQIQIPVLVALLTVIGYSINDTVVVFDRIRENIIRKIGFDFADTVNQSLRQTLSRSVNTSLTTLIVLVALFVFGGGTLKDFSLTLIIGVIIGTYSSLFVAPIILVKWIQRR
ncbi:protein translocase subunit SecF [Patescibacteria group bacterium]|nr:protein translocase subunit SecF [Patescibacteria group bacterium]